MPTSIQKGIVGRGGEVLYDDNPASDSTTWTIGTWTGTCALEFSIMVEVATGSPSISLYINSDTTATNYHRNHVSVYNGTAPGGAEGNDGVVADPTNTYVEIVGRLHCIPSGKVIFEFGRHEPDSGTQVTTTLYGTMVHIGTAPASITQLVLSSSVANAIDTNSHAIVRRLGNT